MTREQQMADLLERCASVLATLVDLESDCYNAGLRRAEYEIGMAQTFVVSARGRILHALQETT